MTEDCQKVYICDLGIAKTKRLTEISFTCQGKGPGTFPYMSPEMFTQSRRGPAADIYSLGCLFIELFGRRRIWPKMDGPAIMQKVLGSYKTPPQGPSAAHLRVVYAHLCSKMTNLVANLRPSSRDILSAVKQIEKDSINLRLEHT